MAALHERYHGRKPVTASTRMGDDMLACLFSDLYHDFEKTMIEMQRDALVPPDPQRLRAREGSRSLPRGAHHPQAGFEVHLDPSRRADPELELFISNPRQAPTGWYLLPSEGQHDGVPATGWGIAG